jgi:flagellar protein FlaI
LCLCASVAELVGPSPDKVWLPARYPSLLPPVTAIKGGLTDCPAFRLLPAPLQEESRDKTHLLEYLHALPLEEVGVPQYVPKLERSMGDLKNPNLIYPIKNGLYVHVYPDESDIRDYYIAIEPGMMLDLDNLLEEVEERLVDYVAELDDSVGGKMDRAAVLKKSWTRFAWWSSPES